MPRDNRNRRNCPVEHCIPSLVVNNQLGCASLLVAGVWHLFRLHLDCVLYCYWCRDDTPVRVCLGTDISLAVPRMQGFGSRVSASGVWSETLHAIRAICTATANGMREVGGRQRVGREHLSLVRCPWLLAVLPSFVCIAYLRASL